MQKCPHRALFAFNKMNIRALRSVCTLALYLHSTYTLPALTYTLPALYLHSTYTLPAFYLHSTCTYITATYHNIGR